MTPNTKQTKCDKCDRRAVFLTTGEQYCVAHAPLTLDTEQTEVAALIRDLTQAHAEQGFLAKSEVRDRLMALVTNARTQALREALEVEVKPPTGHHCSCVCKTIAIRSLQPNKE